jgi:hypothetical protein
MSPANRGIALAVAALMLPAASFAQAQRKGQETTQQGSGTRGQATAAPGPGIEAGTGNAMAGGRTDFGPAGVTGIDAVAGLSHDRALAKANDQARGENGKGSFLRPADTAPDMDLSPQAIGSGAEEGAFPTGGKDYFDSHSDREGKASGIASGSNQEGGAASQGSAGKGAERK